MFTHTKKFNVKIFIIMTRNLKSKIRGIFVVEKVIDFKIIESGEDIFFSNPQDARDSGFMQVGIVF